MSKAPSVVAPAATSGVIVGGSGGSSWHPLNWWPNKPAWVSLLFDIILDLILIVILLFVVKGLVGAIAPHPDGSLIRFSNDPSGTVYIIQGGTKRGITSADAFNSQHYNWGMIVAGNQADQALPNGPFQSFRGGTLVEPLGSPSVYSIVDYGNNNYCLYGVPNQTVFYGLGFDYSQVMNVPGAEIPYPVCAGYFDGSYHGGGQFVNINGNIWMIGNGVKYRVPDPAVNGTYGFPLYPAAPYDASLPDAGLIWFHEGTLIKGSSNSVYMVGCSDTNGTQGFCNAQKHGFTSQDIFQNQGYNFGQVVTIPDGDLGGDPTGSQVIDTAPAPAPPTVPSCLPSNSQCNPNATYYPPSGSIDTPSANSKVSGNVNIAGWALDNSKVAETKIQSIAILINGQFIGNATYGINRGDACSVQAPGCPNVGWSFSWNTAAYANATYEIEATILDSDPTGGKTLKLTRNVTTDNSLQPSGTITSPAANSQVAGRITIAGWAMDNATRPEHAITGVQVAINNQYVGNAVINQASTVAATICNSSNYPNRPGCPNIGWSYTFDTTPYKKSTMNIKITVTDADSPPSSNTFGYALQAVNVDPTTTTCAAGYSGTPPNCKLITCPVGQTGTPPNCVTPTSTCPAGQTGTPPNCKPPVTGTVTDHIPTKSIGLIYAYPSDVNPDVFMTNKISWAANAMQTYISTQTKGVLPDYPKGIAFNFDSHIVAVKLPHTLAYYVNNQGNYTETGGVDPTQAHHYDAVHHTVDISAGVANALAADVTSTLHPDTSRQHFMIYMDGYIPDSVCGLGDYNGPYGYYFIKGEYFDGQGGGAVCSDMAKVGGSMPANFNANIAPVHEIFHTFGIVPSCSTSYSTVHSGHTKYSNDLMYYAGLQSSATLDAKHDDYWGTNIPGCPTLTTPAVLDYFIKVK